MIDILSISLRLTIWLLLTADLSWLNIAIGLAIAVLLPRFPQRSTPWAEQFKAIGQILLAIPQAYLEAIAMILKPHKQEYIEYEAVPPKRSPALIFLDIFRITFTPKTIVLKHDPERGYQVHHIRRRRSS